MKLEKTRLCLFRLSVALLIPLLICWYLWTHVFDTLANRARVSDKVRYLVQMSRADPGDNTYVSELLSRAHSSYSFEATVATVGLGEVGDAAVPVITDICDLMQSADPFVRREAANSLLKLGHRSQIEIDRIASEALKKKVDEATMFCTLALGKIGKPAVKYLPQLRARLGTGGAIFDGALRTAIQDLEQFESNEKSVESK